MVTIQVKIISKPGKIHLRKLSSSGLIEYAAITKDAITINNLFTKLNSIFIKDNNLSRNGKKAKEKLSKNNPVTIEYGSLKVKASTASAKSIINAPFF